MYFDTLGIFFFCTAPPYGIHPAVVPPQNTQPCQRLAEFLTSCGRVFSYCHFEYLEDGSGPFFTWIQIERRAYAWKSTATCADFRERGEGVGCSALTLK